MGLKNTQVDLYYDVISPYSWIAFEALLRYEKVWNIKLNLKPFILRDIMKNAGNKPPMTVPNKGIYMLNDLERNNSFWGMHLTPPANFAKWVRNPNTTTAHAMQILTAIQQEKPEFLERASRHYWNRLWTQGEPIFSNEDHEIVLKAAGVPNPQHFISKLSDEKTLAILNEATQTASEQSAFGAPWIVVHQDGAEHSFFGSDRFHLIAHLLGETFTDGKKDFAAKFKRSAFNSTNFGPKRQTVSPLANLLEMAQKLISPMKNKYLVDLYFDVMSPFSWIGFEGIMRHQHVWPISIKLKPFWLREIFVEVKNKSPVAIPNKMSHMIKEFKLLNDFWGLNMNFPKDFKKWVGNPETSSENAMKILLAIQRESPELVEKTSRQYWNRIWSQGLTIFSQEDHELVLKEAGFTDPRHWIESSKKQDIEDQLRRNAKEALDLGCFGAPWIVVHKDEEKHCFFGSDRFHLIGHLIGETFTDGKKEFAAKI